MRKVMITVAVSGAETTRAQHPQLPLSPEEIADSAYEAYQAGAAILHLHVRDEEGKPTQSVDVFKKVIDLVRSKCDMVIEISTGGAVGMSAEERIKPVMLQPDMASLDCGSLNFGEEYILNPLPVLREFIHEMDKYGVRPAQECFDLSNIYTSRHLIKEGLLKPPFYYGFGFQILGGVPYSPDILELFVRHLPEESIWTTVGISKACLPAQFGALAMGGHIRVGFEDNVYMERGVLAKSNAELVDRSANIVRAAGFQVATPDDVRALLKLRQG